MRRAPQAAVAVASAPAPEAVECNEPATSSRFHIPFLTLGILTILSVVFWAELRYPVSPAQGWSPSIRTIIALGAMSRDLIFQKGEWWRFFTAPLMHGGIDHIVGNAIALFFAGRYLEKIAGWRWTAALFVFGAMGGGVGSMIANPPDLVTVGASGAIMALLAALFVLSFDNQVVKNTFRMQRTTLLLLIPALVPSMAGSHVDVGAHMGGAITGGVIGYALQIFWDEDRHLPKFDGFAVGTMLAGVLAGVVAFTMVSLHLGENTVRVATVYEPKLMTEDDYPGSIEKSEAISDELVRRFPDDPRTHAFRALKLLSVDDITGAQSEIRTALDMRKMLAEVPERFTVMLQILLAATEVRQGRVDDARQVAAPACGPAEDDGDLYTLVKYLKEVDVCPDE